MWFFPQLLVLSSYFTLLDVMGAYGLDYQGPQIFQVSIQGGVRIINPPLSNLVICLNQESCLNRESIQSIFSHWHHWVHLS